LNFWIRFLKIDTGRLGDPCSTAGETEGVAEAVVTILGSLI
jgi:hypothetical protein